jgi:hypothetical protein
MTAATRLGLAIVSCTVPWVLSGAAQAPPSQDPLAAEIARWNDFLRSHPGEGVPWNDVRSGSEPVLARAETALRDGRRLLALYRLSAAREGLAAAAYLFERTAEQRKDTALFEAEWRRMGEVLRSELAAPTSSTFDGVRPAAVRAIGEAALLQVRGYYEASLDYGRSTMLDAGFYYIGSAAAQRDLVAFLRGLPPPATPLMPPALRGLGPELDALEAEIVAAYRPPASLDRHREFILASSALKEARELDAAGLRHGALLRYLQAVQRCAPLRASAAAGAAAGATPADARLRELEEHLSAHGSDHTIGRIFLETAQALSATDSEADRAVVQAIVADVLPRYLAALEPARPQPARAAPRVTVTLVRWPYT